MRVPFPATDIDFFKKPGAECHPQIMYDRSRLSSEKRTAASFRVRVRDVALDILNRLFHCDGRVLIAKRTALNGILKATSDEQDHRMVLFESLGCRMTAGIWYLGAA